MSNESSFSKSWHITLWVLQGLLALAFGAAGAMKFTMPADVVAKQLTFVSPDQAGEMVDSLRTQKILGEFRGEAAVDRDSLVACLTSS
ncbi:MAG: hypothetical protein EBV77_13180 [Gemmatimonadaceae bacterium]|nr:hypothetical protein [Gemmatimonadaceae bacterium]